MFGLVMRLGYAHYILGVKSFYASTSSVLCRALDETPQRAAERVPFGARGAWKTYMEQGFSERSDEAAPSEARDEDAESADAIKDAQGLR